MHTLRPIFGLFIGSVLYFAFGLAGALLTPIVTSKGAPIAAMLIGMFYIPAILTGFILGRTQTIGLNSASAAICPTAFLAFVWILNVGNFDQLMLWSTTVSIAICGIGFAISKRVFDMGVLRSFENAG